MRDALSRSIVVTGGLVVLLAGCDARRPTDPGLDEDESARLASTVSELTAWSNSTSAIHLAWPDQVSNESGWEVHRSSSGANGSYSLLVTLGPNATGHSDTQLAPKTEGCYKVRSFRTTGRKQNFAAFSNSACASTWGEPPAPSSTGARPASSASALVFWTDGSQVETGFRLEKSADAGGPWEMVVTLGANASSYTHGGLTTERAVCYRVIAFNSVGDSPPSAVVCTAPPASPTGVAATAVDGQTIDVAWTDASAVEDGYELQRATSNLVWNTVVVLPAGATAHRDAGLGSDTRYFYRVRAVKDGGGSDFSSEASAVTIATLPPAPTSTAAYAEGSTVLISWTSTSQITEEFRLERSSDGQSGWTMVTTVPSTSRSAADPDRPLEERVCHRVIASNRVGDSAPSTAACTTPLAPPTDFAAAAGDGDLLLSWGDASRNNTIYYLEYYRIWYGGIYGSYEWWEHFASLDGDATSLRVSGLSSDRFHQFRLYARSDDAVSAPPAEAGAWTFEPMAAPSDLFVAAVGQTHVDLSWTDNSPDETRFIIEICYNPAPGLCGNEWWHVADTEANRTTYRVTGLEAGITYNFRVRAASSDRISPPSNTASASTLSQPQ